VTGTLGNFSINRAGFGAMRLPNADDPELLAQVRQA
jgi:hypothetical protein